jgi:hypothetical protein
MIARRKGDDAALPLLWGQLQQAVAGPAQFEAISGLEALALEPYANTANLGFEQRGPLDDANDSFRRFNDIIACHHGRFR